MDDAYYIKLLSDANMKMGRLNLQRDEIEAEIVKTFEFIQATANMLSDPQKEKFLALLKEEQQMRDRRSIGLTEAIRKVLQEAAGKYFTVTQIRERLKQSGFDFSSYTANPLASISSTVRRMKPEEVETTEVNGVTAFRWVKQHTAFRGITQPLKPVQPPPGAGRLAGIIPPVAGTADPKEKILKGLFEPKGKKK